MTRVQTEGVIQDVLGRFEHGVGRAVTEDESCLGRLLATLRCERTRCELADKARPRGADRKPQTSGPR